MFLEDIVKVMDQRTSSYEDPPVNQQVIQNHSSFLHYQPSYRPPQEQDQTSNSSMSLEEIISLLSANTLQFQQDTNQFNKRQR